jgi:hypothetical protein
MFEMEILDELKRLFRLFNRKCEPEILQKWATELCRRNWAADEVKTACNGLIENNSVRLSLPALIEELKTRKSDYNLNLPPGEKETDCNYCKGSGTMPAFFSPYFNDTGGISFYPIILKCRRIPAQSAVFSDWEGGVFQFSKSRGKIYVEITDFKTGESNIEELKKMAFEDIKKRSVVAKILG